MGIEMKTTIMTITHGDNITRVTVDSNPAHPNTPYYILSKACEAILVGFGPAKASKLYDIRDGGEMVYTSQGQKCQIKIEVVN